MSSHLIIVDKSSSFKFDRTDLEVLTTKDYIARPELVRTQQSRSSTSAGPTAIWERAITAPCWRKRAPTR